MKPNDSPIVATVLPSTSATVSSNFSPLKLPEISEAVLPSDEEELQSIKNCLSKRKKLYEDESDWNPTSETPTTDDEQEKEIKKRKNKVMNVKAKKKKKCKFASPDSAICDMEYIEMKGVSSVIHDLNDETEADINLNEKGDINNIDTMEQNKQNKSDIMVRYEKNNTKEIANRKIPTKRKSLDNDTDAEYATTDDDCITSPKSRRTFPKNYASDMPLIYIVNVEKEEKIKKVVAKTEVIHNKRNYCPFCNESKVNFLPHLKQHEEEEEVAVIFKQRHRKKSKN